METAPRHYKPLTFTIICSTFICYINVGMTLVALPIYLSHELGLSATAVGAIISLQFFATLVCRPIAGNMSDLVGAKQCVITGMLICCLSGVATFTGLFLNGGTFALLMILLGRVALGFAQGLIGTGTLGWIIGVAGKDRMAKLIGWNGMAGYSAMAIGAPVGAVIIYQLGYASIGIIALITGLSWALVCSRLRPAPLQPGKHMSFLKVFSRIAPFGLALSLSNIGFGVIATFITLYYASNEWQHAAWGLSAFSLSFVGSRLFFSKTIARHGGFRVALVCLTVEGIGLITLCASASPMMALIGAVISGLGLSLIYPSLGVEAVVNVSDSNRSSALGAYSLCQDLSVGMTGPVAGVIAASFGYPIIFGLAGACSFLGVMLVLRLRRLAEMKEVVE